MVFDLVAKYISEVNDRDVSSISPDDKLADLGIDSLDTVEVLMNLEDRTGVEIIPDDSWVTVNDLVSYVELQMTKKAS